MATDSWRTTAIFAAVAPIVTPKNPETWLTRVAQIPMEFQPIVDVHRGLCLGCEARAHEPGGGNMLRQLLIEAEAEKIGQWVYAEHAARMIELFGKLIPNSHQKLLLGAELRWISPELVERTATAMQKAGLAEGSVCFTLRGSVQAAQDHVWPLLRLLKSRNLKLAIGSFGLGEATLTLLYKSEPHFVLLDPFFVQGIDSDARRRHLAANLVNSAHSLGALVIAPGIESPREFTVCREIGCDFAQGGFVQQASDNPADFKRQYAQVEEVAGKDRRAPSDQRLVLEEIQYIPPMRLDTDMMSVFERFRQNRQYSFFPVVDEANEPVGVVREYTLKSYAYAQYGVPLLKNKSLNDSRREFMSKFPVVDINTDAGRICELFSADHAAEGVLVVKDMKYAGVLFARSLLKIVYERSLSLAMDKNPLTKLPGNTAIYDYIFQALNDRALPYIFVYFDFDFFKAFNDLYGFRKGDRIILLFAEILQVKLKRENVFIAHIGGDDFFVGIQNATRDEILESIGACIERFREDVIGFYELRERIAGFIQVQDRDGAVKQFPITSVSAAVLDIPAGSERCTVDDLSSAIAVMKKQAKRSESKIAIEFLHNMNVSRKRAPEVREMV